MDQWAAHMEVKKIEFLIHTNGSYDIAYPVIRVNEDSGVQAPSLAWQAPDPRSPDGLFVQIITCPTNAGAMNVSLGIAEGLWKTAVTLNHQAALMSAAAAEGVWNAAYNAVAGNQGEVAVNFIYSRSADWETRMVYVSGDGGIIPIQENRSRVNTSQPGGALLISSNEFARIKEFRLQKRKYQWVDFRNVSLRPGQYTRVEVIDAGVTASTSQGTIVQQLGLDK
jgi:hypothetical protein